MQIDVIRYEPLNDILSFRPFKFFFQKLFTAAKLFHQVIGERTKQNRFAFIMAVDMKL